jgi:rhodanese-related sulfurtransferase
MKSYNQLLKEAATRVEEILPWDLEAALASDAPPLVLDVREPAEYDGLHIPGSIHAPRGQLETACEWGFDETIPALVEARDQAIVVVCRSGHRSLFAADRMREMGYTQVRSLRTGLRGWNEYDQPLINQAGTAVDPEEGDVFFTSNVRPEQMGPQQ